jgi:hypothetical protein
LRRLQVIGTLTACRDVPAGGRRRMSQTTSFRLATSLMKATNVLATTDALLLDSNVLLGRWTDSRHMLTRGWIAWKPSLERSMMLFRSRRTVLVVRAVLPAAVASVNACRRRRHRRRRESRSTLRTATRRSSLRSVTFFRPKKTTMTMTVLATMMVTTATTTVTRMVTRMVHHHRSQDVHQRRLRSARRPRKLLPTEAVQVLPGPHANQHPLALLHAPLPSRLVPTCPRRQQLPARAEQH